MRKPYQIGHYTKWIFSLLPNNRTKWYDIKTNVMVATIQRGLSIIREKEENESNLVIICLMLHCSVLF